jgi:hypothetical protein
MKKYAFPVEIHTHTEHSDGNFTPEELIQAGRAFGYSGMILTDHNSSSGYSEMIKADLTEDEDFILLKGMEWTTYFGHMLVHDADYDADWREATPDTIDTYMKEVKEANGLIGIAHPFDMGSPICTGCHWDFNVKDYNLVDYIEIWNSNQPQERKESQAAYDFWLKRLNEGYKISASTGRDWHRPDGEHENMGVTYIEVKDEVLTKDNFKQALADGHFYITLGPEVRFTIKQGKDIFYMGDNVSLNDLKNAEVEIKISQTTITTLKQFSVNNFEIQLWNNNEKIYSSGNHTTLSGSCEMNYQLPNNLKTGYLRYEVVGQYRGDKNSKIVIGNPIYID